MSARNTTWTLYFVHIPKWNQSNKWKRKLNLSFTVAILKEHSLFATMGVIKLLSMGDPLTDIALRKVRW
jgi:hypothetical protein